MGEILIPNGLIFCWKNDTRRVNHGPEGRNFSMVGHFKFAVGCAIFEGPGR